MARNPGWIAVCLALLALSLAGCSSGGGSDVQPSASGSAMPPPQPDVTAPASLTDTLYFLDAPHLAATLPVSGSGHETAVPEGVTAESAEWSLPRPGLDSLQANATIWVDIRGSHIHTGAPSGGCFWAVGLRLYAADGTFVETAAPCPAQEEAVVEPGIRALQVTFDPLDIASFDGETVSISISAGQNSPGSSIHVLGGTREYPSQLTIVGVQLPLDMTTLL